MREGQERIGAGAKRTGGRLWRLEALRGAAAAYVVLGHIGSGWYGNPLLGLPVRFGLEAVILFFLISGFVIEYSAYGGRKAGELIGFGDYLVKRVRRIYPLFLLALGLSYLSQSLLMRHWAPARWG